MVIHQSTIQTGSKSGSKYRASRSILQRAKTIGSVGCECDYLLDVLNNEVRVFLSSNNIYSSEYKSTQQVQPPPRRGI